MGFIRILPVAEVICFAAFLVLHNHLRNNSLSHLIS